jgi:alpha-ketoglutarate-dependent taurine dioxygenase
MIAFLSALLSLNPLDASLIETESPSFPSNDVPNEYHSETIRANHKIEDWTQDQLIRKLYNQLMLDSDGYLDEDHTWESIPYTSQLSLLSGDLILFGFTEDQIHTIGLYLSDDQFIYMTSSDNMSKIHSGRLSDFERDTYDVFSYQTIYRPIQQHFDLIEETSDIISEATENEIKNHDDFLPFLDEQFECTFINEQKMPLVISPKSSDISLSSFRAWAELHQIEFKSYLGAEGALLLRNFPVENPEEFASVIQSVLGVELLDYRGGEGSRKKVAEGVYTSTEAPPQFNIPLHHEFSCTNNPASYICFYCDIPPEPGSGQTILGLTEQVTQELLKRPEIWNFFNGQNIKYISRHPPEGSFFSKVNITHKTWPQVFETHDREEVEKICREKGFAYRWLGDWFEFSKIVPAIKGPDEYFDHPYWFNQAHLYHSNPRLHGGWVNHILHNLLYISPSTRQYDVELEDGTPIPKEIVYGIYDVLEQQTIKFSWQKGDILIVDNIKAFHGRASYKGERRILAALVSKAN